MSLPIISSKSGSGKLLGISVKVFSLISEKSRLPFLAAMYLSITFKNPNCFITGSSAKACTLAQCTGLYSFPGWAKESDLVL